MLSCAACDCLRGPWAHRLLFYPLLPFSCDSQQSAWDSAQSSTALPFPTRQPHVTKHCSSLSHILHNKFLFCRVLSHMVLEDFSAKHRIIFQFRWVAWFYVVLKLLDKWSQLLISVRWRESHMDDYNLLLDLEPPLCLHPPENSGSPHCGPESWCLHSDF